jgi:hypothetical protein
MSLPLAPFPMFSQHDWLSAQKPGEPANIQVKSKLESIAESCQALESYKYASMFFESTLVSFEGSNKRRHRDYSRSLERMLNWSFLVAGKSVFDWAEHDIQCYLAFVTNPDVSWVSSSPSTRFITGRGKPFNQWDINPNWKPFARSTFVGTASQLTRHGVQVDRKILLEFLSYIVSKVSAPSSLGAAVAIEKELLSPEKTSSSSLSSRLGNDVAIFPYELDWVFNRTMGLIKLNWRYSLILFVMAVARYTRIPIVSLCRGQDTIGLLSQFQCRGKTWYFIDKPGTNLERTHKLGNKFYPYLKSHLKYLGVSQDEPLPDIHILMRPGAKQGFVQDSISKMIEEYRDELRESALICEDPSIFVSRDIFPKLTLAMIRRSQPHRKGHGRQRDI